ncbi:P-loop NTPase fold protein [Actinophytocola sp.]|uniref:KAP family P-loop NTPase fold protein n=1 Tax=Actinophytocola sp. TaxID=1872138 RepID=UPI00389AB5D8
MESYDYTDAPIDTVADDLFGRRHTARLLADRVHQSMRSGGRTVVALSGPWGSGKTSTLNLTRAIISGEKSESRILEFRPWIYSDYSTLLGGFFSVIENTLPKRRRRKVRKQISKYLQFIAPFGKAVPGFDASGIIDKAATAIGLSLVDLDSARGRVEKELSAISYPIVVFIDDIDRLHPSELTLVFKLIREIAKFPNVTYLLSFDYRTVVDLLASSELAIKDRSRAVEYLDKIMQVRVDVPPLHEEHFESVFELGMNAVLAEEHGRIAKSEITSLYTYFRRDMNYRLSTPRAIKKFFAQLISSYSHLVGEVDFHDLFVLTFVQTFEQALYVEIPARRTRLTGALGWDYEPQIGRARDEHVQFAQAFISKFASGEDNESVKRLLSRLFSQFSSGAVSPHRDMLSLAVGKRVESPDYFDRYFHLNIPPGDVSDRQTLAALEGVLSNVRDTPGVAWYREQIDLLPRRIFDKTRVLLVNMKVSSFRYLVEEVAAIYEELPDDRQFLAGSSKDIAQYLIIDCLEKSSRGEASDIAVNFLLTSHWRLCLEVASTESRHQDDAEWLEDLKPFLLEKVRDEMNRAALAPVQQMKDEDFRVIFRWADLVDKGEIKAWLWQQVESGRWSLIHLLARFVGKKHVYVAGGTIEQLGELDQNVVSEYFDIDLVVRRLGSVLDGVHRDLYRLENLPPSTQNQIDYALTFFAGLARNQDRDSGEPVEEVGDM